MTLREFWTAFVKLPNPVTGELVTPVPHQAQVEAMTALDAVNADTGLRQFSIHLWHWARKVSKDLMLMTSGLHHLAFDPWEKEPRYVAIAAWDREQTEITRRTGEQMIARHPWLASHFKIYRNSIVFVEQIRDARTGGRYQVEHMAEFLSRDTKGSHGLQISMKIHNELHTDVDYSFEEALMPSPARRSPVTIYASYHGLLAQQKAGVPLYDLLQRAKQGDPRIAYNYVGGQGDRAPWVIVPWITPAWVDEQRALLTHAPNRFRRMILNVPAGPDAGLIAADELQDAIDKTLSEPETGVPGTRYVMAVDLGIANDWSCICLTHVDEDSRVVVDLTRTWRPQNGERVNLGDVEIEIRRLAARFTLEKIILDQWQAEYIQQRLAASGPRDAIDGRRWGDAPRRGVRLRERSGGTDRVGQTRVGTGRPEGSRAPSGLRGQAGRRQGRQDCALDPESREALRHIDLNFHDLRREAGSRWLDGGVPLHRVQMWLGHSNIAQTSTYLRADAQDDDLVMRRFEEQAARQQAARPASPAADQPFSTDTSEGENPRQNDVH